MGQDSGMDAEPSWLELRDQRDILREALENALYVMEDGHQSNAKEMARVALKEAGYEK